MANFISNEQKDHDGIDTDAEGSLQNSEIEHLSGHQDAVLCLDLFETTLASGSEDSTVRIWNLDQPASGASLCICRCFQDLPITSVAFSKSYSQDFNLYAAAGTTIFVFDLSSQSILIMAPDMQFDLSCLNGNYSKSKKKAGGSSLECIAQEDEEEEEEINQIAVHPKTGQYLSAALDNGSVVVLDLVKKNQQPKVMRKHANICSTVAFHPRTQWDLASGSYDQTLFFWDFSRGRPTGSYDLKSQQQSQQQGGVSQVVNPPFVHSLSYSLDGRYLASGLGDGSIALFEQRSRSCVAKAPDAHTAAVSQVKFAAYAENILLSAGNDKMLHIWDMTRLLTEDSVPETNTSGPPTSALIGTLKLEEKPNWICSSPDGRIIVADTSNRISVFRV